jgi:hypothetical protein
VSAHANSIACPFLSITTPAVPLRFRTRAIELAEAARREDDKGQRKFLIDKARAFVDIADTIDPPPPPGEPPP